MMQTYDPAYESGSPFAIEAAPSERAAFIRRTYAHLAFAILAFIGLEAVLLHTVDPALVMRLMVSTPFSWLIVMVAFMGAGWLAQAWARSETSLAVQYAGLALYVVAEALIFLPLLMIAVYFMRDPKIIPTAGLLTLMVFGGLTSAVFVTKKDFSFLGPALCVAGWISLGVILCLMFIPALSGMTLLFCFAMVALMSGYILYYTSQIMYHHRTDQHVAAALALFACIATLFWYILQIVMSVSGRD